MALSSRFISLEGGEGSGKSTQLKLLAEWLKCQNIECVTTREPGGTPLAESIRPLLVQSSKQDEDWHPVAETLLFLAARLQHVTQVITPALLAGKWVLCDRFADSTFVYQGVGRGLGIEYIQSLQRLSVGSITPDKTFLLDINPEMGLARAISRCDNETRFESLGTSFHHQLRKGFLHLAEQEPQRIIVMDADQEAMTLHRQITSQLEPWLE